MKKRIAIIGGIVVAVALVGAAGWHFLGNNQKDSDQDQVYVTTVATLTGDVSGTQNRYAGIVEPQKTVNVKVENGRTVGAVKVEEGQLVKAGDVLFEYDESATQTDLAQAQLDLDRYKNEATSLQNQIDTLNRDKANAGADEQLSYTIQIQTAEMDLKKNEYNQKSKEAEIEKLEKSSADLQVTSEIDGVVRTVNSSAANTGDDSDDSNMASGSSSGSSNFITIVATGTYRVKGTINETNMQSIVEGDPVIIRSRVDSDVIWKGTMEGVETEKQGTADSGDTAGEGMDDGEGGNEQTQSSTYPFYVSLESSDGLMLGQHVYIEMDYGQSETKEGIWLDEFYIVDANSDAPYVWASNSKDRLEKRVITLGEYDAELGKYQVTDGLTKEDCIAFPDDTYEEGMVTSINANAQNVSSGGADAGESTDMNSGAGIVDEGNMDSGMDSSMDSGMDSGMDSSMDSGMDSSMDSGSDDEFQILEGGE